MRKVRLAAAFMMTAVVAGGCGQGVERLDGAAAPDGVVTSSPTPSAAASVTPSVSSSPSASSSPKASKSTPAALALGPRGLGELRLGMTVKQAQATGTITGYHVEDYMHKCGAADIKNDVGSVYFTPNSLGLSLIWAGKGISTPEGIQLGSTEKAVRKAYPDYVFDLGEGETEGNGNADVPGNSKAFYAISLQGGKVSALGLVTKGDLCQGD